MERVKVSKIAKQIRGVSYKPEDLHDVLDDNSVTLLRANNIQDGKVDFEDVLYVDKSKVSQVQYLQKGDILVCASSGSKSIVGKAASIDFDGEYTFGAFCKVVRPIPDMIDYLGVYFQSQIYRDIISKAAMGANINNIRNEHIDNLEIPEKTSKEISSIIQRIKLLQYIIDRRNLELQKLDELVKARFVEMFIDWDESKGWSQCTISDVSVAMRTGPFGSALHHDEFVDKGVFVLGIDNAVENKFSYNKMRYITEEKYCQLKRYTVFPGDVIITIMGTVGRSAVIPDGMPKAINTKHLACITVDKAKIDPYFLSSAFQIHPDIRAQLQKECKGAIMNGLNLTIIKGLSFKCPPLALQEEFVAFYKQIDKVKLSVQNSLEQMEILKKALMQQYFG